METGYCLSLSLEAREEYIERILQLKHEREELRAMIRKLEAERDEYKGRAEEIARLLSEYRVMQGFKDGGWA